MTQMSLPPSVVTRSAFRAVTRALAFTCAAALAACGSPAGPTPPPVVNPPPANSAPVIQGVQTSVITRTEVDTDVAVTVAVTDAETAVDALTYTWTASAGTITGTGRAVTWRLAKGAATTPQTVTISVVVQEPYQALENNVTVTKQHRVEASAAPFLVHDSTSEAGAVGMKFLGNFANNNVPPEVCVADFSDACPDKGGKEQERLDIARVRSGRLVEKATLVLASVSLDGARTAGTVKVACRFESLVTMKLDAGDPYDPGDRVYAEGECTMSVIYDAGAWKLCSSSISSAGELPLAAGHTAAEPGRRMTVARAIIGYR